MNTWNCHCFCRILCRCLAKNRRSQKGCLGMLEACFLQHILEWSYDLAVGAFCWFWVFFHVGSRRSPWHTQGLPLPQTLKSVQLSFENAVNVFRCPHSKCLDLGFIPQCPLNLCMLCETACGVGKSC